MSILMKRMRGRDGYALIMTLALMLLIVLAVIAFLARAMTNRQIAFGSAALIRTEMAADLALQRTLADLQLEIKAGNVVDETNTLADYPRQRRTMVAWRDNDLITNTTTASPLLRTSRSGQGFWEGDSSTYDPTIVPPARASAVSTLTASANGRRLTWKRWLRPAYLKETEATPFENAGAPDWIYVLRDGVAEDGALMPSMEKLVDKDAENPDFAIARYAFTLYDVGGLVDVNAAGNRLPDSDNALRRRPNQIRLSNLPLAHDTPGDASNVTAANALLNWRNPTHAADAAWMLGSPQSFIEVASGADDQRFISRQDLIQFSQNQPGIIRASALPLLTTFSRSINQPSFIHDPDRPKVQPAAPKTAAQGDEAAYPTQNHYGNSQTTGRDEEFNPPLMRLQDTNGSSLIKERFPLSRLAWLTHNGPAAGASEADILTYFGLRWNNAQGHWDYTSPDHSSRRDRINRPDQIPVARAASTGPDFFELLMSGIHLGSLGRSGGRPAAFFVNAEEGPASDHDAFDENIYYQILRIGANIIDQYDEDYFPAVIGIDNAAGSLVTVAGIEDLPYVSKITGRMGLDKARNLPLNIGDQVHGFWQFVLFNPNSDRNRILSATTSLVPSRVRIRAEGFGQVLISSPGAPVGPSTDMSSKPAIPFDPRHSDFRRNNYILLTQGNIATGDLAPGVLDDITHTPVDADEQVPILGIPIDPLVIPNTMPNGNPWGSGALRMWPSPRVTFILEYRHSSGQWRPYMHYRQLSGWTTGGYGTIAYFQIIDPRCISSGFSLDQAGVTGASSDFTNMSRNDIDGRRLRNHYPRRSHGFGYQGGLPHTVSPRPGVGPSQSWAFSNITQGTLGDNSYSGTTLNGITQIPKHSRMFNFDPDGIPRPAMGGARPNDNWPPNNMGIPTNIDQAAVYNVSRTHQLNRPFRNLGELGNVSRDQPWKNLDFFSPFSGDTALLDLFTLEETAMSAGRINPNRARPETIRAALAGSALDMRGTTLQTNPGILDFYAQMVHNRIVRDNQPLLHRGEMNRIFNQRLGDQYDATWMRPPPHNLTSQWLANNVLTARKSTFMGNLIENTDVRVWNLCLDLVVQSGRFPSNTPANRMDLFQVHGERRYWVHLAIDRLTGRVLDIQREVVYE